MQNKHTQLIIFGASGNLAKLKLIPGLYHLLEKKKLPDNIKIWGFSRRDWDQKSFADEMKSAFQELYPDEEIQEELWNELAEKMDFISGDFDDQNSFETMRQRLEEVDKEWNTCADKIFYFSVQPSFYSTILDSLKKFKLDALCSQTGTKVVIEKPFGHDYESSKNLNEHFTKMFKEEQIFRIDHVLGKDTLLDILSFRKNNIIFREVLKPEFIDHIQISMLESISIGDRGEFYEENGVIRDMVQNHLLQILAIASLDLPEKIEESDNLRNARCDILATLRPVGLEDVVLGQYQSYRDEEDVTQDSNVPTFVALKTHLQNSGWDGTPVYMRTGKRLNAKYTEVNIVFKDGEFGKDIHPNILTFRIQPQEGVSINLLKDKSHYSKELENITMDFCYKDIMADAYENLLYEVLKGNRTHFVGIEEVYAGWKFVDPINKAHEQAHTLDLKIYEPGSWGPHKSYELIERDGRYWMTEHFEHVCRL